VVDYDSIATMYDTYAASDADVPFFTARAREAAGPVLELTSGTGRLSIPLIEAGADLTCVDCSRGMLDVLRGKLAARGLSAGIHCADVCKLSLPGRFALAILPFQSFMEIVGEVRQRAALAAVFACLRPGGSFVCTMHNPAVRRRAVDGVLRVLGGFPYQGGSLVVSGSEHGGRPVVSRLQVFEHFGPDGMLISKRLLPMEFELVERDAFAAMAGATGFRVVELLGDYGGGAYVADSSPVMIWVLERPA
jgi:SAM-dependent methyltransferase